MTVTAFAPAKINLTLDVTGRREDGYHLVETVMQTVGLYDTVSVSLTKDSGIHFSCNRSELPTDDSNTVVRAARLFCEDIGVTTGLTVLLHKHIPSQAGLAGGSADAAGVLAALNVLFGSPLSPDRLLFLASQIGADVPFCLQGGTALATGIGTELTALPTMPDCFVVLVKPEGGVSTPEAYRRLDDSPTLDHPDTQRMLAALREGNREVLFQSLGNVFERAMALPYTEAIRSVLESCGGVSRMSGSGSAVFGLFTEEAMARTAMERLIKHYPETVLCTPCAGIILQQTE